MATEKKYIQTPEGQPDKVELKAELKHGKMKGRKVTVLLDADDVVREQAAGFVDFVRERAIVGLAIGFIIGVQAQTVIKQLVDSFITPMLDIIFGGSLQRLEFVIGRGHFKWGMMLYALINLVLVLTTIYVLVKLLNLDKLDKPKEVVPATATKSSKKSK